MLPPSAAMPLTVVLKMGQILAMIVENDLIVKNFSIKPFFGKKILNRVFKCKDAISYELICTPFLNKFEPKSFRKQIQPTGS